MKNLLLPLLMACACAVTPRSQESQTLRVGTWNIENLGQRKERRTRTDFARMAQFLHGTGIKVLAVQEVRSHQHLQPLLTALGPSWRGVLGTTGDFRGSDEAMRVGFAWDSAAVILLHAGELLQLPRQQDSVPIFHRVPVTAAFRTANGNLDFRLVTVHLKASRGEKNEKKRQLEMGNLVAWLSEILEQRGEDRDVLLLGDFNHTYGAPAHRVFAAAGLGHYLESRGADGARPPTIKWFPEPIDQIAALAGIEDEVVSGSFTVHGEGLLKDAEDWFRHYSDHVPVSVLLRDDRDRDPRATFAELPAAHRLPLHKAAVQRVIPGPLLPGDAVVVHTTDSQAHRGILAAPLGEWVQILAADGKLRAFPVHSVDHVEKK